MCLPGKYFSPTSKKILIRYLHSTGQDNCRQTGQVNCRLIPLIAKRFARSDDIYRERLLKGSGMWRYNEIIGYVRLYLIDSRIHGEYLAKRTPYKGQKKKFEFFWVLAQETKLPTTGTSYDIYCAIREHVDDCRKKLKKHYLDADQLSTIGPYVDWRVLFEWD